MNIMASVALLSAACALAGCTQGPRPVRSSRHPVATAAFVSPPPSPSSGESTFPPPVPSPQSTLERSIDITIEVNKCDEALDRIEQETQKAGGMVLATRVESPEDTERTGFLRLRVPSGSVDSLLAFTRLAARRVVSEGALETDIRPQIDDVEARLASKARVEAEYGEMLRSARTTSERLEVSRALMDIREGIRSLEQSRAALRQQTAYPEVRVRLRERNPLDDPARPGFWKKVRRAFEDGGNEIADVVSWIIRVSVAGIPALFLLGILGVAAVRIASYRQRPETGKGSPMHK